MKNNPHKQKTTTSENLDKSNVFVEVNSRAWRSPQQMSLEELLGQITSPKFNISKHIDKKTIVIDPSTLKIRVDDFLVNTSNVHHDPLNQDIISIYQPPKGVSDGPELHLRSDTNYLYVWVGDRWKRTLLSEW